MPLFVLRSETVLLLPIEKPKLERLIEVNKEAARHFSRGIFYALMDKQESVDQFAKSRELHPELSTRYDLNWLTEDHTVLTGYHLPVIAYELLNRAQSLLDAGITAPDTIPSPKTIVDGIFALLANTPHLERTVDAMVNEHPCPESRLLAIVAKMEVSTHQARRELDIYLSNYPKDDIAICIDGLFARKDPKGKKEYASF